MNKMIAYCGLDCARCDARTATINDDNALREQVAALWTELNEVEITRDMINCMGCCEAGVKTPYCDSLCEIRKCAMAKGFSNCGSCSELEECRLVAMIVSNNDEALRNLKNE